MGQIAAWVGAFIAPSVIRAVLGRILVALGISAMSVVGFNAIIGNMTALITGYLGGVPSTVLQMVDLCGFREAMSIMISGYTTALAVKGLTNAGKLTRIYWDKSSSIVLN